MGLKQAISDLFTKVSFEFQKRTHLVDCLKRIQVLIGKERQGGQWYSVVHSLHLWRSRARF